MNVRIFWVRAMKCMYAQTRPRFILSSEGVFWGNGVRTHVNSKGKIPSTENVPRGGSNPRHCGQRAQALPTELFRPPIIIIIIIIITLKGAIQDILQSPHCTTNRLQHVHSSGLGVIMCKSRASHQALITCNMQCATWYEGTARLLSFTESKLHLF